MTKCNICKVKKEVLTFGGEKVCFDCLQLEFEAYKLGVGSDIVERELTRQNKVCGRRFVYKRFNNPEKRGLYEINGRKMR